MVNERKFLNQAQPQTLVLGTLLLYINAVFGLLFGVISTSLLLGLATIVGLAIGGGRGGHEGEGAGPGRVGAPPPPPRPLLAPFGGGGINYPGTITPLFDRAPRGPPRPPP